MPTDWPRLLADALPAYGFSAAPSTHARLGEYLQLVADTNARVRLVGSADPETLVRRHLGESLYLRHLAVSGRPGGSAPPRPPGHAPPPAAPLAGPLADVGSGAGFPGLALALACPELKTTLVEATGKKADFLRTVIHQLGLEGQVGVEAAFLARRRRPGDHNPLAGAAWVTVRALDKMEEVPGWLGAWMDPGARAAFWVSAAMATAWRQRYPGWRWQEPAIIPGSESRTILIGSPVLTTP